jgi:hypothetical protein
MSRHPDPTTGGAAGRGASRLDFPAINAAALACLPTLLARWLPDGRCRGKEYQARNPRRHDRYAGSFSINLQTGRWADFATGDRGGDPISLAAYLAGTSQRDAARELARMLELESRR